MKKLRCESCGGELRVEENNEYASCDYCRTRYKLNDDKTIVIKIDDSIKDACDNVGKNIIPFAIGGVCLIIIFIVGFGVLSNSRFSGGSVSRFNSDYEIYSGTEASIFVEDILDKASTNNKTKKRKITVVYNDISTDNPDEIVNIKHSLGSFSSYEVKLDYDNKGYVNKIIIEDIK